MVLSGGRSSWRVDSTRDANVLLIIIDDMGAKASAYEDGVHVPLIVTDGAAWADHVAGLTPSDGLVTSPGSDVTGLVHVVDLFATITEVAGASWVTEDFNSFAAVLDDPSADTCSRSRRGPYRPT